MDVKLKKTRREKKEIKRDLNYHLSNAIKNRPIMSFLLFFGTFLMALCLILNIKVIEFITQLLITKGTVDTLANTDDLQDFLNQYSAAHPNDIFWKQFSEQWQYVGAELNKPEFMQEFIHRFMYSNVEYQMHNGVYSLTVNVWGHSFGLFDLVYIIVLNIVLVIILSYAVFIIGGYISQSYETLIKKNLINKLIDQDLHYFRENKTGEIVGTLVKESNILAKHIKEAPIVYSLSMSTFVLSSVMMFFVDWKLSMWVFGLLVGCLAVIGVFIIITTKATKKIDILNQKFDNQVNEKIYSVRLIKATGNFDEEKESFEKGAKVVDLKNKIKFFFSELPAALLVGGVGTFSIASIIFGVILYHDNTNKLVSIMTSFTSGVIVMAVPILQLRQVIAEGPESIAAAINISKILKSEIYINKHELNKFEGNVNNIKFNKVTFSYPGDDKIILNNLEINLEKGKKYAFVGPTGCGKSTIAKLLLRFYDPSVGEILINDKTDLKSLNLKSWLDKVGYVDQEPQILSGTIYENICYSLGERSIEEVQEAAKKAKLHDLIMSWPNQYDTMLFERGAQLSGGQKQRLVIARLILKNPEVLVLDEATSALDNIVEKEIQEELEKLMFGRTTVSIAHRLRTIKNFDKIFVFEQGEGIVQSGTYEELIKVDGLFKELYKSNLSEK
ncbi:ABC transporter ATP-binding protein [Spiroplasma helicoides]|uniref:ABC transporter ATP-binding protein n=1 Tax=Spiroplasma helicoides TaxID=216938 RepID=A0A1B3SJJ5_9MOLU|nr:ABC transporter ATP-binding protein/permease [Spiroplasma helicoides]AOG60098.1 ABC transporter ATP-binding protein [Spiroplasma helicoides]